MSESTSEVVQESSSTNQELREDEAKESECSIMEYFIEHPGFFVTCISGLVAILSFILNYGVTRYHVAVLSYWNISRMYADKIPGSQLYSLSYILIYSFALLIVHLFLAQTSQVFAHYNRYLSLMGHERRTLKKHRRTIKEHDKTIGQLLEKIPDHLKESKEMQEIGIDLMKMREDADKMLNTEDLLEKGRRELRNYTIGNISISAFLSCLALFVAFLLIPDSLSWRVVCSTALMAVVIVLLDVVMYFLPAYLRSRYPHKRYLEIGLSAALEELEPLPKYQFPLIDLLLNKTKELFSNDNIKALLIQICTTMIIMLFSCSIVGSQTASTCKKFPIYTCEGKTYAIVYTNGTTAFGQEASIDGNSIIINTARQKVMSAQDITFQISEFTEVIKLDVTEADCSQTDASLDDGAARTNNE